MLQDLKFALRLLNRHRGYAVLAVLTVALGVGVIDADDTPQNRDGLKRALSSSPDARVEVRSMDLARDTEVSPYRFNAIVVPARRAGRVDPIVALKAE